MKISVNKTYACSHLRKLRITPAICFQRKLKDSPPSINKRFHFNKMTITKQFIFLYNKAYSSRHYLAVSSSHNYYNKITKERIECLHNK